MMRARLGGARLSGLSLGVLLVGLVISGVLAWASRSLYTDSEAKVLRLRVRDAGAVLSEALPAVETPLASAAAIASETDANAQKFASFAASYAGSGRQFSTISLWELRGSGYEQVAVEGEPPGLSASRARQVFSRAAQARLLSVSYVLDAERPAIGYTVVAGARHQIVVYAQSSLPRDHRTPIQQSSEFSDLDFALYLHTEANYVHLIATSVTSLPIRGEQSSVSIPYGDATLELVMTPRGSLVGTFFADFSWVVAAVGVVIALLAAVVSERLVRRRRSAEDIAVRLDEVATENERLYDEQRTIAASLQHALLPERLPEVAGLEVSARYVSGVRELDIGGDWYDMIRVDDGRLLVVVGDVSGRGMQAATIMASLRFAIRAYALQGDGPGVILAKLSRLLRVGEAGHFATAICMLVDVAGHELTLSNAGHPPPLVAADGVARYVRGVVGLPIGVVEVPSYESLRVTVPDGATLVLFTDGLVERRGEMLDVGLDALLDLTSESQGPLAATLVRVVDELMPKGPEDDAVILGMRWRA